MIYICLFPERSLRNWLEIEDNNLRNADSGKMLYSANTM